MEVDLWMVFSASAKAIISFWLLLIVGFLVGRKGLLTHECLKVLSDLSYYVFSPCLLFDVMLKSLTLQVLDDAKILVLWCCIHFLIAFVVALVAQKMFNFEKSMAAPEFIVACCMHNCGNLVIIIMDQICRQDILQGLGGYKECFDKSVMLIFLYGIPWNFFFYGIGWQSVENLNKTKEEREGESMTHKVVEVLKKTFLTPPVIGLFLGGAFALIPFLKELFYARTAAFYPVYSVISLIGAAAVPCSGLILSGNLYGTVVQALNATKKLVKSMTSASLSVLPISPDSYKRKKKNLDDHHEEVEMRDESLRRRTFVGEGKYEDEGGVREGAIEVTLTSEEGRGQEKETAPVNKVGGIGAGVDGTSGISGGGRGESCCSSVDNRACISFTILAIRLIIIPAISFGLVVATTPEKSMQVLYLFILLIEGGMPTAMSTPMMFTQLNRDYSFSLVSLTILVACSMYYSLNHGI